jgi:hypothetical protein
MPGQEVEGATGEEQNRETRDPETMDNPDEGPTMSGTGASPAGNAMDHWATAMPNTDATKPETMPEALGGSGETPNVDEQSNPA